MHAPKESPEERASWVEWGLVWAALILFLIVPWFLGLARLIELV